MKFILILYLWTYDGGDSSISAEFNTKSACNNAVIEFSKNLEQGRSALHWVCVPKGDEDE